MKKIHVGFLLSYDYEKLKYSIPPVYDEADAIFVAMDKDQRTWSGNTFQIDDGFFKWLKKFDVANKIIVYKDDFCKLELTAIQNDTRERYMLSKKMGIGNWLVQVDADEIFIDFTSFVKDLKANDRFLEKPKQNPIQIAGFLINIYKYLDEGLLYVDEPTKVMLATNYPNYKYARNTKERVIYTNNILLHESLSRSEEELRFKLENWGHSHEINSEFMHKWRMADVTNYKTLKNLFYLDPEIWKSIDYFPTHDRSEIKTLIAQRPHLQPAKMFLLKKNFGQWFKFLKIFNRSKTDFEPYF